MRKGPLAKFRFKVQLSKSLLQKKSSQRCLTFSCYPLHQGSPPVSWCSCLACSSPRSEDGASSFIWLLRPPWVRGAGLTHLVLGCPQLSWLSRLPVLSPERNRFCQSGISLCCMNVDTLRTRAVLEAPVSLCDFG